MGVRHRLFLWLLYDSESVTWVVLQNTSLCQFLNALKWNYVINLNFKLGCWSTFVTQMDNGSCISRQIDSNIKGLILLCACIGHLHALWAIHQDLGEVQEAEAPDHVVAQAIQDTAQRGNLWRGCFKNLILLCTCHCVWWVTGKVYAQFSVWEIAQSVNACTIMFQVSPLQTQKTAM